MRPLPRPNPMSRRSARLALLPLAFAAIAGCGESTPTTPVPTVPLSAVVVNPSSDTLLVGQRVPFTVTAFDTLGQPTGNAAFAWTSTNPLVAVVDGTGRVTGEGEGLSLIIVSAGGHSDTATVYVIQQAGWYTQASSTTRNLLGVFFLPDGQSGWAVGSGGALVHTVDAGVTWAAQVSNSSANLNAVWFTSASEGWIAGNAGTVLHTLDAGQRWTRVNVSSGQNLMDVTFSTATRGFVVGTNGALIR